MGIDYTRQNGIYNPKDQRLNIIVVGAGCTGSYTVECLVRLGFENVTVRNLKVIKIIPEDNLILVKGAVPGSINSIVELIKP